MALTSVGLTTHIQNNQLKSIFLLMCFPFLLCVMLLSFFCISNIFIEYFDLGRYFDRASGQVDFNWYWVWHNAWRHMWAYAPYVFGAVVIWFLVAWFYHGRMIRAATHAMPVTRQQMPRIYNLLENLCISRGLPMPQFEVIDTPALNAFASGLTEKNYKIVLTHGIIDALDDDELEAVIAHELTHIINKDVRLMMVSIVFVGIISFALRAAFQVNFLGRHARADYYFSRTLQKQNNARGAMGGAFFIKFITLLIVLSLGYFFGLLIRFTLSQKREFLADAGAVELTKNPEAMMCALMRISGRAHMPTVPKDVMQMCIENSYRGLFRSHPPIEERIAAISRTTNTPVPTLRPTLRRVPRRPWGADIHKKPPRSGVNPWGVGRQLRRSSDDKPLDFK